MYVNKININVDAKSVAIVYTDKDGQRRVSVIRGQKFGLLGNKTVAGTGKTIYEVVKSMLFNFIEQQHLI